MVRDQRPSCRHSELWTNIALRTLISVVSRDEPQLFPVRNDALRKTWTKFSLCRFLYPADTVRRRPDIGIRASP